MIKPSASCDGYTAKGKNMKARIVDNLLDAIEKELPREDHRADPEFLALCCRIQGQVVDLVFVSGDAFEATDNNYWLPESCWVAV